MSRIDKFMPIIFAHEGGYVNDPKDSGGETKYGISKRAYPHVDIKNLTKLMATAIYKKDYYDKLKIDSITDDLLALHLFDFGVNAGVGRATRMLQIAADVHADGIIGRDTINAANKEGVTEKFIEARIRYYKQIGVGKNAKFLNGWLNRVMECKV